MLQHLPLLVWTTIFGYLAQRDKFRLLLVCRELRSRLWFLVEDYVRLGLACCEPEGLDASYQRYVACLPLYQIDSEMDRLKRMIGRERWFELDLKIVLDPAWFGERSLIFIYL